MNDGGASRKAIVPGAIEDMLRYYLLPMNQVMLWNERKNGNQSPIGCVSRYWKIEPDDDFIDLDALIRNISYSVYEENSEFEEK